MNIDAIEPDVVGHHVERVLGVRSVAKADDLAVSAHVCAEFQQLQDVVMRVRGRRHRGEGVRRLDLRQVHCRRWCDPRARRHRIRNVGPDGDVAGSALRWQREVAGEGRARLQEDDVARLRAVDGGLEIATLSDGDGLTGRCGRWIDRRRGWCCGRRWWWRRWWWRRRWW